jgi:DNA-binding GntR family transcriptional regulator
MDGLGVSLDKRTLVMQIADALRAAIVQGKFDLGAELLEARLSQDFNVGRGTLREALQLLYAEGLIEKEPRKAWRVRKSSDKTIWEVVTVRATLEGLAAHLAAQQISAEGKQRLTALMADMETAAQAGDSERFNAADFLFHRTIVEMSGNEALLRAWLTIGAYSWLLLINSPHKDLYTLPERVRLHQALVDVLLAGTPAAAEAAFRKQIYDTAAIPSFSDFPRPWSNGEP